MSLVWKRAPYKGEILLLFLALADWSNDEGYCWPKTTSLATKARVGRSTAKRGLARLEEDGFIEFIHRSRGGIGNLQQTSRRRRRQQDPQLRRLGHEVLINLPKLNSLPVVGFIEHEELSSRRSLALCTTGPERASEAISTTGPERASQDFHHWPTGDMVTGPLVNKTPQTPHKEETLRTHERSVEPSVTQDDSHDSERSRWTLVDDDDGRFFSRGVWEAYSRLTGNRLTPGDKQDAEALSSCGFSSEALKMIFSEVKRRAASKRIGTLRYFRVGVEELAARCQRVEKEALRMMVGAGDEQRLEAISRAVRREVESWKNNVRASA